MKKYFWIVLNSLLVFLMFSGSRANIEIKSNLKINPRTFPRQIKQANLPDVEITLDEIVASGFSLPIQVTNAGDGTNRLFIVEQTGKIRVFQDESVLEAPFIDLGSLIVCCGERGLLGLAFHPDYASNGY